VEQKNRRVLSSHIVVILFFLFMRVRIARRVRARF